MAQTTLSFSTNKMLLLEAVTLIISVSASQSKSISEAELSQWRDNLADEDFVIHQETGFLGFVVDAAVDTDGKSVYAKFKNDNGDFYERYFDKSELTKPSERYKFRIGTSLRKEETTQTKPPQVKCKKKHRDKSRSTRGKKRKKSVGSKSSVSGTKSAGRKSRTTSKKSHSGKQAQPTVQDILNRAKKVLQVPLRMWRNGLKKNDKVQMASEPDKKGKITQIIDDEYVSVRWKNVKGDEKIARNLLERYRQKMPSSRSDEKGHSKETQIDNTPNVNNVKKPRRNRKRGSGKHHVKFMDWVSHHEYGGGKVLQIDSKNHEAKVLFWKTGKIQWIPVVEFKNRIKDRNRRRAVKEELKEQEKKHTKEALKIDNEPEIDSAVMDQLDALSSSVQRE